MISSIDGKVEFRGERFCVLSVSGVGYKVFSTGETLKKLPEKGGNVKLWTHLYVREDALELYGFINMAEMDLFETLIRVPGIGPKGALGVLSIAPVDTLKKAIASGDTSYLTRVSGIGRKTAEKIVLELKEKMAGRGVTVEAPELGEEADALETLVALGYSQREAREALSETPAGLVSAKERVKDVLKRLGRRNT